eukprot:Nitzschia sp. Nitz4//scaffold99_size76975//38033//39193//NITZ4_005576-RA/size76975-snap-gene-0.3-mRNA-1//1//CDS//3329560850//199//frame0
MTSEAYKGNWCLYQVPIQTTNLVNFGIPKDRAMIDSPIHSDNNDSTTINTPPPTTTILQKMKRGRMESNQCEPQCSEDETSLPLNPVSGEDQAHVSSGDQMRIQQQLQLQFLQQQMKEISLPPSRSPKVAAKRRLDKVCFCEDVFCYANPRDYDEILSSWYSRDELSVFKGARKTLIRELKKVNFDIDKIDRSVFQLRGMENYLSIGYNKHVQNKRKEVLETVLAEQRMQQGRGENDVEALREACCKASEWARGRGEELGRWDAEAAGFKTIKKPEPKTVPSSSWGNDSDLSAPSLCSTVSLHSSRSSIISETSMDSLGSLDSVHATCCDGPSKCCAKRLERVDEGRQSPMLPPSYEQAA